MSWQAWAQAAALLALVLSTPLLGAYLAKVYGDGGAPATASSCPVERALYRVGGVDPEREQRWRVYALSLLAFSVVSVVVLYAAPAPAGRLPLNPTTCGGSRRRALAFNTAVSFVTNTNWQNYARRVDDVAPHPDGRARGAQLRVGGRRRSPSRSRSIRGLVRRRSAARSATSGSTSTRDDDPRAAAARVRVRARARRARAWSRTSTASPTVTTVDGADADDPRRPDREPGGDQGARRRTAAAPTTRTRRTRSRTRTRSPTCSRSGCCSRSRSRFTCDVREDGRRRDGRAGRSSRRCSCCGSSAALVAMGFEVDGQPAADRARRDQESPSRSGGNMEGKEVRFGAAASGLFAASTTGTSTGAVNSRARQLHARSAARCRSST